MVIRFLQLKLLKSDHSVKGKLEIRLTAVFREVRYIESMAHPYKNPPKAENKTTTTNMPSTLIPRCHGQSTHQCISSLTTPPSADNARSELTGGSCVCHAGACALVSHGMDQISQANASHQRNQSTAEVLRC